MSTPAPPGADVPSEAGGTGAADRPAAAADGGAAAADGTGAPTARPRRSARRVFAATTLTLEAFVVLFATLVAFGLRVAPPGMLWAFGGGLALVLLLLSGMLRSPAGYLAGSLVQIPVVAGGFVLLLAPVPGAGFGATIVFVIAGIFVTLWVVALRLGARIDRERAEWDAAPPAS